MTEVEIRKILFDMHLEYMMHTPKEKEELYEEYIQKLKQVKKELARLKSERKENEAKIK